MQKLWHALILRLFPGTLEEYYAAREIHRAEAKVFRRRPQFVVGAVCFALPLWVLMVFHFLSLFGVVLLLPVPFGFACMVDTITEHYALQLLRERRAEAASEGRAGSPESGR